MCYFINDILCSTLPVNKSVFQFYSSTFLLRIKSADLFYLLRIIVIIIITMINGIREQCSVHVVASDRPAFRNLCKVIQSDSFYKLPALDGINNLTVTCNKFYQ